MRINIDLLAELFFIVGAILTENPVYLVLAYQCMILDRINSLEKRTKETNK